MYILSLKIILKQSHFMCLMLNSHLWLAAMVQVEFNSHTNIVCTCYTSGTLVATRM